MKRLIIVALAGALLFSECAATERPSLSYAYRPSQFRSRLEFLRFCFHHFMINTMELEGRGPCVDDTGGA